MAGLDPARLRRRSVTLYGHRTSVSLEGAFWDVLKRMAAERGLALSGLIAAIDADRPGNLSSALRVAALDWALRRGGGEGSGPPPQQ